MNPRSLVYFFVGTTAEFIKLVPVIALARTKQLPHRVIASGQNDIDSSELWDLVGGGRPDETLFDGAIHPSSVGLASWFARTSMVGLRQLRRVFGSDGAEQRAVVVHGDTVSTLLGAGLGKALGAKIFHVEAGLRSFHYLQPFPEEICRVLVSQVADVAFCPNAWAASHLTKHERMTTVITGEHTLLDSLRLALARPPQATTLDALPEDYFLLVLHRQENLMSRPFVVGILDAIEDICRQRPGVFVLHKLTRAALERHGLLKRALGMKGIHPVERLPYVTFTHVLSRASFIITDGGSNQEESYFLGKPCLLLRKKTERIEGLDHNVLLTDDPAGSIRLFAAEFERYIRPPVALDRSPSKIIVEALEAWSSDRGNLVV